MSPTPTPAPGVPLPLPDALHEYAAQADGNLDALLGHTVTSPWIPFAWTALAVITVLAVAALVVIVWKTREGDTRSRYRQEVTAKRAARREALRLEDHRARREAAAKVTFTPANPATDDLPNPPVDLDEER